MRQLDVIVPVYRGLQETQECIISAVKSLPAWAELIVVNDCSPEPELTAWLQQNSTHYGYQLFHNEHNLGFVATVNFAMALHPERDVLLLNSDVEVANSDWLTRMRDAAYSHDRVASLTPFSNNATICSFPHFCQDNHLYQGLDVDQLDALFAALPLEQTLIEVPTGVGFCMYIRRDALQAVGYFDEQTFGKGYGEENDWCQRAHKQGWLNYHQLNVFAYHKGGVSFQEEGDPRKAKALELLTGLHPNYTQDVMRFVAQDPAKSARLMAKLSHILQSDRPVIIAVSHRLGGGVMHHVQQLALHCQQQAHFLRLSPAEQPNQVNLFLTADGQDTTDAFTFDVEQHWSLLLDLCRQLGVGRVHFHHTMGLAPKIWGLPSALGVDYDVTIHDYYFINGHPTLTDSEGRFVGDKGVEEVDKSCAESQPTGFTGSEWRSGVLPLLSKAERIIFPCQDVLQRFSRLFGHQQHWMSKALVSYHEDNRPYPEPKLLSRSACYQQSPLRVLVLGALSPEKGADLLEKVACQCHPKQVEFHLLGYAYRPLRGVITHGAYLPEQVDEKIDQIQPDVVWFPAQVAETYSYTLSIALANALPVVCSALGAFIERVAGREQSILLPYDMTAEQLVTFWCRYAEGESLPSSMAEEGPAQLASSVTPVDDFYTQHYMTQSTRRLSLSPTATGQVPAVDQVVVALMAQLPLCAESPRLNQKERLLRRLWLVSQHPLGARLARVVPYRIQRKIKRLLSRKPLHHLM